MANPTKDNVCPHGNQIEFCVPCDLGEALSSNERLIRLELEVSRLRKALQGYGTHADYCALYKGPKDTGCNCGLFEALGLLPDGKPMQPSETPACLWQQEDPDNEFFFATTCGQEGVNREMSWIFCPHCGKRLTTSLPEEPFCNQAAATSSGVVDVAPMPRGSLPNSLGTGGAGSHPAASSSEKASGELPLCDCDPDFGCKEYDPKIFRCCQQEMERRAAQEDAP